MGGGEEEGAVPPTIADELGVVGGERMVGGTHGHNIEGEGEEEKEEKYR